MTHSRCIALAVVSLLLASAGRAQAWTVTTHQAIAVWSAQELDGGPQSVLLANELYLRAGSMGPDIFYQPPKASYSVYSDLAHYCRTDELAKNMIRLAKSDKAVAFGFGWFSHNVADSVAHPWVNGFTGRPYGDPGLSTDPEMSLKTCANIG